MQTKEFWINFLVFSFFYGKQVLTNNKNWLSIIQKPIKQILLKTIFPTSLSTNPIKDRVDIT